MNYDVFNGDADGLCALHQLRLENPAPATLVTGVKRDIKLLDRVEAGMGDQVTVLDISLDSNRKGLMRLLEAGASVEYFDHHYAGEIPLHQNLAAHIDLSAQVCTSILVDRYLRGHYRLWAIVAAFGDNLGQSGRALAKDAGLSEPETEKLASLGEYLNYNGYGDRLQDLHFEPGKLYEEMRPYPDPFDFIARSPAFDRLAAGFHHDISMVAPIRPLQAGGHHAAYMLPDEAWARRVNGVFANKLANDNPMSAHAVITSNRYGGYTVSVRAPITNPQGADTLCLKFETGGGRRAAAGINRLPADALEGFLAMFAEQFP
ncbi:hypothetical protein C8R31_105143 [Nitrosospira sp. Nsp2]|uniref:acetyltransferase n=1 Tax=Nitrosospira sp. Nsp2 TaxID=136548 RepID=UPI000D30E511|nr:acetyltransferase [Nitrosospira sp. Nsp2]PTR14784.1 hypothetical protein C8R31_105143 [Nitrosospira sp. Nsp2]